MDPAIFPHQVPAAVAYITMGFGVVAGVLLTTLAFTWRGKPAEHRS